MLQNESIILAGDNSGAGELRVIGKLGGSKRKFSGIGNIVTCSVRSIRTSFSSELKKGKICKVLIVNTVKKVKRADGSYISFNQNRGILVEKVLKGSEKWKAVGTRIFIPVMKEFKQWGYGSILALAKEVV